MAEEIVFKLEVDSSDATKSLGKVDQSVESVGDSAKKSQKGVKGLGQTLKALGSAAGVIGLIATAFITLKKALESSEEGQNKLAKFFAVTESIVNNLITLISDLTMDIIELFENPQQAIEDFANLIKQNIVNRFEGLVELIPQLGKAVKQLFEGDFSGAAETAANAAAKVTLGIEDIVGKTQKAIEATVDFTKELINEANVAAEISDKRALADRKERDLIVARAEANRKIAENRERAADKENVSTEERIRLLEEAGAVAEEITRKEIEAARLRFEAIQEENKLSNSNKEAKDAEAEAQARLIELETARLQQQKALTAELTTTRREAAAEQKEIEDQKLAEEKERNDEKIAEAERIAEKEKQLKEQKKAADEKSAKDAIKLKKLEEDSKLKLAKSATNAVIELAGEATAIGKLAAIAQATINTYQGITAALAQTTDVTPTQSIRFANAAAVGIAGALNVKKILSTKTPGKKGAGAGAPSISTTATVAPPEFNVDQTNDNQLADSISGQINSNQPTKAYVVGSDVTNQQQMDRIQLNNATL